MECKKIAFINGKGGCGKTTSIFHVSGVLAQRGEKTLVVDFDKQKNSSDILLMENEDKPVYSVLDFMRNQEEVKLADVVRKAYFKSRENANPKYYGIDVLPADTRMEDETLLTDVDIKDSFDVFVNKNGYKWVLVDMPPSNKTLNQICFEQIVDYVIVPFSSDVYSVQGYKHITNTVNNARQYNPSLNVIGIYLARYDDKCLGDQYIKSKLQEFGDVFIDIQIPDRAEIRDAIIFSRPISYYKLISPSKTAYEKLVGYMEKRIDEFTRKGV